MKVAFVLLLTVLLIVECQCRRGGGGGRSRGSGGSRSRSKSHGSSGGGFWSWLGFGGSKGSSSNHAKPVPSAPLEPPLAPKSSHNNNPIGFEHFGQGGNRHVYDQNNNIFDSNTYQRERQKYKDNKLNVGGIVPVPVPIPIRGGNNYHHYYNGGGTSYGYRHNNNNITTGTNNSITGRNQLNPTIGSLNPGFISPDLLYLPYKPAYLLPKSRNEDPNGNLWKARRDLFLRKYGNGTSLNTTGELKPANL